MTGNPLRAPSSLGRVAAVLAGLLLVAGCASQQHPAPAPSTVPAARQPTAPCAALHCAPGPTEPLTGGYAVRLWSEPQPTGATSATPVVELLRGGQHAGWWTGRLGFGWSATLTCLATPAEPNCVVTSALGAHAGSAETLLLRGGALASPATASVVFDSSAPTAADLDGDGRLDVTGMENDYKPNYAQGHNYWATYRLSGSALHRTGCTPVAGGAAAVPPHALLHGPCPVVPQG
ncbi:MAG TPA: hypothetical protein VMB79_05245 [Jatrophihabitans sp.]|nr:hypothetical protein [Jatrophihabitans sp.]